MSGTPYEAHESQVLISRGSINRAKGDWNAAIADYLQAEQLSRKIDNYRGVTDAGGELAQAYEHLNNLPAALGAINEAIAANTHIADELYLVPRNLAIKAEITAKMGRAPEVRVKSIDHSPEVSPFLAVNLVPQGRLLYRLR